MKRPTGVAYGVEMEVREVHVTPQKRCRKMVQTRCNPKLNFHLIQKHKSNPQFRRVLAEVGLDCLLELRITRLHRELCAGLARKVDFSQKYMNVHATNFGDEFKAKFVLFTIGTLIRPTTNVHLYYREYFPFLLHMADLVNFNWAKFLLDGLLESIRVYQLKGARSLGGCLLYIQLLYIHCIAPVKWSAPEELFVATPCLRIWNDERVSRVLKAMRSSGGLESKQVTVQINGIPSLSLEENPLLPQLLMHQFFIERIRRHTVQMEIELNQKLLDLKETVEVLVNVYSIWSDVFPTRFSTNVAF